MNEVRIALTGFMGVGKSSVARHLGQILKCRRVDLDHVIEHTDGRRVVDIIDADGIDHYRRLETKCLQGVMNDSSSRILSLGGGTWTMPENREILKTNGFTSVWLESSFEHCWLNILTRERSARSPGTNKRRWNYSRNAKKFIASPTGILLSGPISLRSTSPEKLPTKFFLNYRIFWLRKGSISINIVSLDNLILA